MTAEVKKELMKEFNQVFKKIIAQYEADISGLKVEEMKAVSWDYASELDVRMAEARLKEGVRQQKNRNRPAWYIAYDASTYEIAGTSKSYTNEFHDLHASNPKYGWINVTHPRNKDILAEINAANDSNYY